MTRSREGLLTPQNLVEKVQTLTDRNARLDKENANLVREMQEHEDLKQSLETKLSSIEDEFVQPL